MGPTHSEEAEAVEVTTALEIESEALRVAERFDRAYLEYYRMAPLELEDDRIRVAVVDEPDEEALQDLCRTYDAAPDPVPVSGDEFDAILERLYSGSSTVDQLVRSLHDNDRGNADRLGPLADARDLVTHPPVIRYLNLLLRDAVRSGASDIHLESTAQGPRVRLRLDGVLSEAPAPPASLQHAVVSRIKLLAELDIAERRVPQDGRVSVLLEARELDLRVSTVPTLHGESVVLRLLDRGNRPATLDELGLEPDQAAAFRRSASASSGLILSTGPTGSGKTTSLYAALGLRRRDEEKVITVEDPIEYQLAGVTQVPVHPKAGVTFATALRSILRQDPDVVMVGEMRDRETAALAMQAAMTGHAVFSTLHTRDAVGALTRLADLGVEPYVVAATIQAVLAQRLVRRICDDCRAPYKPEPAVIEFARRNGMHCDTTLTRGRGCQSCRGTGFRGRIGVFELVTVDDILRREIVHGVDEAVLREYLHEAGATSLLRAGWTRVAAGVTTAEEVLRVLGE